MLTHCLYLDIQVLWFMVLPFTNSATTVYRTREVAQEWQAMFSEAWKWPGPGSPKEPTSEASNINDILSNSHSECSILSIFRSSSCFMFPNGLCRLWQTPFTKCWATQWWNNTAKRLHQLWANVYPMMHLGHVQSAMSDWVVSIIVYGLDSCVLDSCLRTLAWNTGSHRRA